MSQVLYSKYNSLRRPEFRIVTEIREDNGEKSVVKRAGEPAAEAMAQRIVDNKDLLADYYTNIQVIPVQYENGGLVFPFVKGVSLKEKLVNEYKNRDSFVSEANTLLDQMLFVAEDHIRPFTSTKEFETIFGKVEKLAGTPAVCPANIDALFTNFMEDEGNLICIDYEWVFNFSVPVSFIRYRALRYLHYELAQSIFEGISINEYLKWFGIGEAEYALFEKMEYSFQYYVHGEKLKYHYLHRYLKVSEKPLEAINRLENEVQEKDSHISNITQFLREKDNSLKEQANTINTLQEAIENKDKAIISLQGAVEEKEQRIGFLNNTVQDKDTHIRNLDSIIRNKDSQYAALDQRYQEISNAFFWRITGPLRKVLTKIKLGIVKRKKLFLAVRCVKMLLRRGPKQAVALWKKEKRQEEKTRALVCQPTEAEICRQKETVFSKKIKFSILVPLYNTPEKYLTAMINSVIDQTYGDWELCLADGSDVEHAYVGEVCRKYAKKDRRIKYQKLKENLGISENTNACIDMADGDYIGLFDHDDLLHPFALFEYMQVICNENADFIYSDENTFHDTPDDAYWPHFKPDFAPDTLRSYNYICHFSVFKKQLLEKAGGYFQKEYDGSQDYDLILRLTENAEHIVHIPKVMYYWRSHKESTASDIAAKPYTMDAARKAIAAHLERIGLKGEVMNSVIPSTYKVQYEIDDNPLVSIVIPNKDHIEDLSKCLNSIQDKSTWKNWEVVVVENNSTEPSTFEYYKEIENDERIRVVRWEREFNYSAINNFGVRAAKGEYILLLNNDIEIITPDWIEQMLMFVQRKDVGAAGAMLYYPDDTVQHAGVILGIGGVAGHSHKYFKRGEYGYASRMTIAQNLSAVTAACILIKRKVWDEINGLDEGFAVAFNDVDLCMRIRKAGYLIVWTPYAELYHYESKSRGLEDNPEKQKRFKGEIDRFMDRWGKELENGDPYYNPNLTLVTEDFAYKD